MKKLTLSLMFGLFIVGVDAQVPDPKENKEKPEIKPQDKPRGNPDMPNTIKNLDKIPQTESKLPSYMTPLLMKPLMPEQPTTKTPPAQKFLYDENFFKMDMNEKKALLERIQWKFQFWTSLNYFNNSDLRNINEDNQTSIEETDDRMYFAFTGVELDAFFPIHPRLDFRIDIWKAGFWGHDQLGGRDANNDIKYTRNGANTVNFGNLYLDTHFFLAPTPERRLDLRVGRQAFEVGGQIEREYYLDDTLDSIVLRWHSRFGRLDVLALDLYASGSNTQDVYFVQYLSVDDEKVDGFNGDVNTYRYGFTYMYPFIAAVDPKTQTHIEARAFTFFARYGGLNDGGSDRTNKGTTGNFADNDFTQMRGARLNAGFRGIVRGQLTFAESIGVDRKRPTVIYTSQDVDTVGQSTQLELEFALFKRILLVTPSVFWSEGGKYYADGRQYSHGFVGFKGDHAGGMLTDLNWGLYPSAYVDDDGIDDTPFERQRKTGTFQKHIGIAIGKPDVFYFRLDWWRLEDTNQVTLVNGRTPGLSSLFSNRYSGPSLYEQQVRLELLRSVYPTAATQLAAYRRFSTPLGEEINLTFDWNILPNWRFWASTGVFRPMRYFATAGLEQGTPQGNARFVGFQMGTSFYF
ncbi:MAG: hypothetical protein JNM27_21785 [Leptospirales bacterium]|nr:hypothetical protein [Leptospirales bacterium]